MVRPDAIISVFDSTGRLILVSRDSNITDDQPGPQQNNGLIDMSRGSVGKLDPYIGSVQLPTGNPGATNTDGFTYFIAISSNAQLPQAMNGTFQSGATNGLLRLEPVNSVKRIVEDHIGFTGHTTGDPTSGVTATVNPVNTTGLFPINTIAQLQTEVTPWTLRDVTLYGLAGDQLVGINPSTGASLYTAGTTVGGFQGSIKMRSDGVLFGFRGLPGTPNTVGALVRIDPATGATTQIGVDNIPDFNAGTNPADPNQLTSDTVNSFAFVRIGTGNYNLFYAVDDTTGLYNAGVRASRLYQADPASGNANGNVRGEITAAGSNIGTTTGMAEINGTLYGVSSNGFFYSISQGSGTASIIKNFGTPFRSLTEGPKNLNNGAMAGLLFATTSAGNLICFNTSGVLQPVFAGNASQVPVAAGGIQGISFSPLDWNLWHPTMSRGADAGHGINATFDQSRNFSNASIQPPLPIPPNPPTPTLLPTTNERVGGASFYFGLDGGSPIATTTAQYGVSNDSRNDLLSNPALPNSYNLPGGAFGSLVSNTSFSLATYQSIDKPTLYFNYFLATDGTNSATGMRDSARVFASTDGGTTWTLLATNNSVKSPAGTALRELPAFASASKAISAQSNQAVQELFDNTGGWRQARVDLAEYAGQANIKLRFDFSTAGAALAGSQTQGLPGDTFGVGPNSSGRAANNAFEGFYIDDIIVGLAERGEMVTGAVADTNFFAVPTNPDPQAPTQSLVGPYQLEIRRGEQYGSLVSKKKSEITIDQQFNSNDRLTSGFTITAVAGNALVDQQAFTISDGVNTLTFEYDNNNSILPGRERLAFTNVSTAAQVAQTIRDTINAAAAAGKFVVTATLTDDNITGNNNNGNFKVDLFKATSISGAIAPDVIATVNKTTISEVGSTAAGQATVTVRRTDSTAAALTVSLQAIDPTTGAVSNAVSLPGSVTIPSGQSSVTFTVSGLDNTLLDFTRSVLIRPTVARYNSVSAPLDVTDDETATLTLVAAGAITEGQSINGTVIISKAPSVPLTIRLNSLDTSELAVPATVTIPANQTSATFTINALQDNLKDGNIATGIVASATGVASAIAPITVVDTFTGSSTIRQTLTVAITPTSLAEGGAVGAATVTRTGPLTSPLTVTLTSTNPQLLSVPASVVIPANSASVSFSVTPLNSGLALSREMVLVGATNANFDTVADYVDITDTDVRALQVTLNAPSVAEGGTVTGTVTRNGLTTQALVVTLFTTDSSEATVPTTVTIPVGQSSATFTVAGTADGGSDGIQSVQVGAAARGFTTGLTALTVLDSPVENGIQYNRMGDTNTVRDQGQIQIYGNAISHVSGFGIVSDNTLRDPVTGLPRPGSAINTPTLNSQRLVPGINISNNLVTNFGQGGINFVGTGAANPTGVVSFGRIVNNTIYGDVVPTGVGVSVSNGAGPTIMNNIIANTRTGVSVDFSSTGTTVVDASVFKQNTANLSAGVSATNSISLQLIDPLFVNPLTNNFYLASGSQAIDSSRNSLSERAGISSVKSPLDIPVSPIIAPANDRFGQLRLDDPAVPNAIGLGANIFIDRGAIERADFSKPKARLTTPLDNGVGVDGDPTLDTVFITSPTDLTQFVLQLTDLGVGIDNATVISSNFIFAQDGNVLVDGVDYQFVYNQNTRQVFFQSISVFPPQSSYTITIPANAVADLAGNTLQANRSNGTTVFTIIGNAAPVLTQITPLAGLKNINQVITFAQLVAASDLKVVTAHDLTKAFRIETISAGTLVIRKSGQVNAIPVVPGVTLFEAGDTVTWTPPANQTGITSAFTVVGYDPQNAVIAPALSLSSPPVAVNVNLVDVPPTMTAVDTNKLGNATEDLPFTITYATLFGASNATDANNDQIRFHVTSIQGGTLRISFNGASPVAVALGTSVLGPNDRLIWTPPLNQNNQLNGNNPLAAFSVVAFDGTNDSSPEIPVLINVNPAQDAPILTKVDTLTLGGKNSRFKITYASLLAASDLQNVDGYNSAGVQVVPGHTKEFRVTAIPTGAKLEIRKAATPTVTTPVVIGTGVGSTIVSVGDVLIWTPPKDVSGAAVPAFSVLGYDGANTAPNNLSALPAVQVTVKVLNEVAPNLTTITTFVRPRFIASTITYQNLVANSDLTFQPGNTVAFRITNIDQGTLLINGAAASVGTLVQPGDVLTWSLLTATGTQDAFDVEAVDLNNTLVSLDPVQVKVDLVNVAPTLTTLNTLSTADEQTPFDITYATLLANSNAADINNDALSFRIETIQSTGTLKITKNGVTSVAVAGTLVSAGDTLTWTPAAGVTGSAINAFTVKAFDGLLPSADPAVQVKINVRPWGSEFSLSGIWTINGKLARIQQNGANLTFVNENGVGSTGKYFARDKVTAVAYGLTATVDITTADQGRLVFSNGVIWLRISLGGSWAVNGKLASIVQSNDVQLTFLNDRNQSSTGAILTATSLIASNYPAGQATFGDGKINFNNGEVWSKLDLSPIYTSSIDGKTVSVVQNGTTTLGFVDQLGNTTSGRWTTPTTVLDVGRNRTGTVSSGKITWSGGEVWNTALSIKGTQTGQPTSKAVTITASATTITLTDVNGTASTVRFNGPNTLFGTSGVFRNIIGQRRSNKIYWSNGLVWENFDFNALNALFTA
ncbi:MAG: hypothetical protein NT069_11530 [Planctomycetota bacterium]|nr:hypothetical protein [Planctomycetota bacterium]